MSDFLTDTRKEICNYEALSKIVKNWPEVKKQIYEEFNIDLEDDRDVIAEKKYNPLKVLIAYRNRFKKGFAYVDYRFSKNKFAEGRQFAYQGIGLQSFSRPIRATLCEGIWIDIDIKNAHPVILYQYMTKKNLSADGLKYYCENREQCLKEWCEDNALDYYNGGKKQAKEAIVIQLNTSLNANRFALAERTRLKWWHKLIQDFMNIKTFIETGEEYKDLNDFIKKCKKNRKNFEGSALNNILCEIENRILEECINYCKSVDIDTSYLVKIFDGFQIRIEEQDKLDLHQLSKYIEDKTEYKVEYDIKPFEDVLDLSKYKSSNGSTELLDEVVVENDIEAAQYVFNRYKDSIVYFEDTIYVKIGNIWNFNEKPVEVFLKNCIRSINIIKMTKDGATSISLNNTSNSKIYSELLQKIGSYYTLENAHLQKYYKEQFERSSLLRTCYQNGVFNHETKKLIKWEDATDVYSMFKLSFDCPIDENGEEDKELATAKKFMYDNVLNPLFNDERELECMLKFLACAFAGDLSQKLLGIGTGLRNCGKSLLLDVCSYSMEDYYGTFSADNLLIKQQNDDPDKSKGFIIQKYLKRMIGMSELKSDVKYNATLTKSLSSGGDPVSGRLLHKNSVSIIPQFKVLMLGNQMIKFDENDIFKTVLKYDFTSEFVDIEKERLRELDAYIDEDVCNAIDKLNVKDYQNEDEYNKVCYEIRQDHRANAVGFNWKPPVYWKNADDTIKKKIRTRENARAFILILLQKFEENYKRPSFMVEKAEEYCGNDNNISGEDKLMALFEKGDLKKDSIKCSEVSQNEDVQMLELKDLSGILKRNGYDIKTVRGIRFYKGIKWKE